MVGPLSRIAAFLGSSSGAGVGLGSGGFGLASPRSTRLILGLALCNRVF